MLKKMKTKNIILVCDDDKTLDLYKQIIKRMFPLYNYEIFNNAEDVLKRISRNGFDLLITDYKFDGSSINGLDVARMTWPLGKPVILISCHKWLINFKLFFKYRDMKDRVYLILKPVKLLKIIKVLSATHHYSKLTYCTFLLFFCQ